MLTCIVALIMTGLPQDDPFELYRKANTSLFKGECDQAIALFTSAIRIDPAFLDAYLGRGFAQSYKGEFDKALADMNEAIRLDPKSARAFHSRATVYADKKDYERAMSDLNQAILLDSDLTRAYIDRATIWIIRKDYQKAHQEYQQVLKIDSKAYYAYNGIAWIQATCPEQKYRDGKKAVDNAIKACELSKWQDPFCLDTLGTAYAEAGDFEKAIEHQKKALENEYFAKRSGKNAQKRIKLYEAKKAFRDEP